MNEGAGRQASPTRGWTVTYWSIPTWLLEVTFDCGAITIRMSNGSNTRLDGRHEVARTPLFYCHPVEGIPARLLEDTFGSGASVWIRMASDPNTMLDCQHKVAPTHRLDCRPSRVPQHDCWVVAMWGPNGWKRGFPRRIFTASAACSYRSGRTIPIPIMRILEDPEVSGFLSESRWES